MSSHLYQLGSLLVLCTPPELADKQRRRPARRPTCEDGLVEVGQDLVNMSVAVGQARLSLSQGGIPIGAALCRGAEVLGRGHNQRVQLGNPILHGETDCLQAVGRIGSYKGLTMYSTLMPCYMCAGTIVQFRIMRVVVGEARSFPGARELMEAHGVEVIDLEMDECAAMMQGFIDANPDLWAEDIGQA